MSTVICHLDRLHCTSRTPGWISSNNIFYEFYELYELDEIFTFMLKISRKYWKIHQDFLVTFQYFETLHCLPNRIYFDSCYLRVKIWIFNICCPRRSLISSWKILSHRFFLTDSLNYSMPCWSPGNEQIDTKISGGSSRRSFIIS